MLLPSGSWQVTQVSSPTKLLDCAASVDGGADARVAAGALCAVSAAAGCGAVVVPLAAITPIVAPQTSASAVTSVLAGKPSLRGFMSVAPESMSAECRQNHRLPPGSVQRECPSACHRVAASFG